MNDEAMALAISVCKNGRKFEVMSIAAAVGIITVSGMLHPVLQVQLLYLG